LNPGFEVRIFPIARFTFLKRTIFSSIQPGFVFADNAGRNLVDPFYQRKLAMEKTFIMTILAILKPGFRAPIKPGFDAGIYPFARFSFLKQTLQPGFYFACLSLNFK